MEETSYEDIVLYKAGFPFSPYTKDRYLGNYQTGINESRVLGERNGYLLIRPPRDYSAAFTLRTNTDAISLPFIEE